MHFIGEKNGKLKFNNLDYLLIEGKKHESISLDRPY